MPTLRQRISAFFSPNLTPSPSPKGEGSGSPAPVIPESMVSKFQVERNRGSVIKDCRMMYDSDPRVEKMHRDYARDLLRNGFIIKTEDEAAKIVAGNLEKRLNINQRLEDLLGL